MEILKPPRLKKGDLIGIAAPASPPSSYKKLSTGIRYLEQLGYNVLLGKHLHDRRGYLAGSDEARARDLNDLFSNPKVKAIFMARGGYGSHRILSLLNYNIIKRNPKILVGYSDITALQLAIFKMTRLITFSGPMVATEFGDGLNGIAEEQCWQCLTSTRPLGVLKNPNQKKLNPLNRGMRTGLRPPYSTSLSARRAVGGIVDRRGKLLGGNLSVVTALLGTSYFPPLKDSILVLEELEEPPYKIDRMLHHLKLAGVFSQSAGVVLGEFTDCHPLDRKKPSLTLTQVFRDVFAPIHNPVLSGLHYGHVKGSVTLPLGIRTRLDATKGLLEFLESAVQ